MLRDLPRKLRSLAWLLVRLGPERDITRRTRYGPLTFSTKDLTIGRRLFVWKEWQFDLVEQSGALLVREGYLTDGTNGRVFNVGANIGAVLTALMATGRFAEGFAFEPEPRNLRRLRRNVEENGFGDRISLVGVALSDFDGDVEFELSPSNFGDHRVLIGRSVAGNGVLGEAGRRTITVPVRTLDSVFDDWGVSLGRNSLIWVDVQGHEGQFLRGARRALESGTPMVSEFWPYGIDRAGLSRDAYQGVVRELFDLLSGISDLPALDGPFIHPKAAQRPKLLFVTASSRFRGRQLSPW